MNCAAVSYKTLSPIQICNAIAAYDGGLITLRALRVYFAGLEIQAIHEALRRSKYRQLNEVKRKRESVTIRLQERNLVRLTGGLSLPVIRQSLRLLQRAELLSVETEGVRFTTNPLEYASGLLQAVSLKRSTKRPIPVPRRLLRELAAGSLSVSVIKTMLAHLLRGISFRQSTGEINNRGTVKASWIAKCFALSERSVKQARAYLIRVGWISKDTNSVQRKLNRDGAYFEIALNWNPTPQHVTREGDSPQAPVDNSNATPRQFAPPPARNSLNFAPPIQIQETPTEKEENQKRSGVYRPPETKSLPAPSIHRVIPADLHDFSRMESLYWQAIEQGMFSDCDAMPLNFLGAAIRARKLKRGTPVRVFMGIIRRGLWHHLTQAEEDQAHATLKRFWQRDPNRFAQAQESLPPPRRLLTTSARLGTLVEGLMERLRVC